MPCIRSRREIRHLQRRLNVVYPDADPLASWDEAQRHAHRDLVALPRAELLAEQSRLRHRLLYDPRPSRWLFERARAIEARLRHAR
jgi:hypothetical protein